MDDLLKDAIADAKAVRETALANAKIALEEAFTPRIQSMLSNKIQSEMEGEEEIPVADEDEAGEEAPEIAVEPEVGEEVPADEQEVEIPVEEPVVADEEEVPFEEPAIADEEEEVPFEEPAIEGEEGEEDVIEINGVKYAPVVSEEEEEFEAPVEEQEDEDELDLESILKELEDEADEADDEVNEEYEENEVGDGLDSDEVETADQADLAENDVSSDIGDADNKVNDEAADSSDVGQGSEEPAAADAPAAGHENSEDEEVDDLVEVNGVKYAKVQEEEGDDEVNEEDDIDLEEILKALSEGDDEEEDAAAQAEAVSKLKSELGEHRKVVKYLRGKLNEVNLLNAKLLFTNKLFRAHGLNNEQKLKVVETFDRATNLREVKLVFATLAESFGSKPANASKPKPIKENKGSASKATASTKPKSTPKVIEEGFDMKARFKKLANIL